MRKNVEKTCEEMCSQRKFELGMVFASVIFYNFSHSVLAS